MFIVTLYVYYLKELFYQYHFILLLKDLYCLDLKKSQGDQFGYEFRDLTELFNFLVYRANFVQFKSMKSWRQK